MQLYVIVFTNLKALKVAKTIVAMEKTESISNTRKLTVDTIPYVIRKLSKICDPSQIEVEARLKENITNSECVNRLLCYDNIEWHMQNYVEKKKISKFNRKCTYRQRNGDTICKSSIMKADINELWSTIHVSTEIPIQSMSQDLIHVQAVNVERYRGLLDSDFYVDIILSSESDPRVEIELRDAMSFDIKRVKNVLLQVCRILQGSQIFVSLYDWRMLSHIMRTNFGPFCIEKERYQKPRTMTIKHLRSVRDSLHNWTVTPKVDGVREFIITLDSRVFSVSLTKQVQYEEHLNCIDTGQVTILDCEYVNDMYYIFDIAVNKGKYCGNNKLYDRIKLVEDIQQEYVAKGSHFFAYRAVCKPYEDVKSFDNLRRLHNMFSDNYNMDGLIFANKTNDYMSHVYKWKDVITVDLEICSLSTDSNKEALVTSDSFIVDIPWKRTSDQASISGVWEFSFNAKENMLIPVKHRPDKIRANSKEILENNLRKSVPGTIFSGVGCYLMRKYHNTVKLEMLSRSLFGKKNLASEAGVLMKSRPVILDIGTGQGGDFTKWSRANCKVYCVEPDKLAIDEMIRRHGEASNIVVINKALKEIDLDDKIIAERIDLFVAFFCMNLFSIDDWSMLERIINKKGSEKCRLLAIAITNPEMYNNKVFKVEMHNGNQYSICVHNTRISRRVETAVEPDNLDNAMRKCNLVPVMKSRLDKDTFMTAEELSLSSMYTMFVYKKVYKRLQSHSNPL